MSGSSAGTPPVSAAAGNATDPSMEDILASIRRILNEDEAGQPPPAAAPESEVLTLDSSMRAEEPAVLAPAVPSAVEPQAAERLAAVETEMPSGESVDAQLPATAPAEAPEPTSLVAPEAAAATTATVSTLLRTLAEQQALGVHRGGPTLEDIVREEIRPLLKAWLDHNLPPLVERVVSSEIQRLIGRAFP